MIVEQSKQIIAEVNKAFIGKEEIVEKVLMTIYAGGVFQGFGSFQQTYPVYDGHTAIRYYRIYHVQQGK